MPRRQLALVLAFSLIGSACAQAPVSSPGPTGGAPQTAPAGSSVPIDAVADDGTVVSEIGRAATSALDAAGGAISATGSSGIVFSANVPESGLVEATTISITPIREQRALSKVPGVLASLRLEPAGTIFPFPVELAIPYDEAIPETQRLFGLLTSDGGKTWSLHPAIVSDGQARIAVHHFSDVSWVLADFNDQGLRALDINSSALDALRNNVFTTAYGHEPDAVFLQIEELLIAFLTTLRDRTEGHLRTETKPLDERGFLSDVSDYIAIRRLESEDLPALTGRNWLVLGRDRVAPLVREIEQKLGFGLGMGLVTAAEECADPAKRAQASAIVREQFAWVDISRKLEEFYDARFETASLRDDAIVEILMCPNFDTGLVSFGDDELGPGRTPHLYGPILFRFGSGESVEPQELLPTVGFRLLIEPSGTSSTSIVEATTGPDGDFDVPLSPMTGEDVGVEVIACLNVEDRLLTRLCRHFAVGDGASNNAYDLSGNWAGDLQGGNITGETQAAFELDEVRGGEEEHRTFAGFGTFRGVHLASLPAQLEVLFDARLDVRVFPDKAVEATLAYESALAGMSCKATVEATSGALTAENERLTLVFAGSACLRGEITLDLAYFGR